MVIEKTTPEQIVFSPDSASARPGAWFLGRFIYWEKTLKKSIIAIERSRERTEKLLTFFTWLLIFAGWLAFGFWVFYNSVNIIARPLSLLFFWSKRSLYIYNSHRICVK